MSVTAKAQKQIILNQNEGAPYRGILIPESAYRSMHVDIFAGDKIRSEFQECELNFKELETKQESNKKISFVSGFITGLLTTVLIVYVAK